MVIVSFVPESSIISTGGSDAATDFCHPRDFHVHQLSHPIDAKGTEDDRRPSVSSLTRPHFYVRSMQADGRPEKTAPKKTEEKKQLSDGVT